MSKYREADQRISPYEQAELVRKASVLPLTIHRIEEEFNSRMETKIKIIIYPKFPLFFVTDP